MSAFRQLNIRFSLLDSSDNQYTTYHYTYTTW